MLSKMDKCRGIAKNGFWPGGQLKDRPSRIFAEHVSVVAYPEECWYCGLCQSICPVDAITVVFPERMVRNQTDVVTLLGKVVE